MNEEEKEEAIKELDIARIEAGIPENMKLSIG